jgi:hypothetical protein
LRWHYLICGMAMQGRKMLDLRPFSNLLARVNVRFRSVEIFFLND